MRAVEMRKAALTFEPRVGYGTPVTPQLTAEQLTVGESATVVGYVRGARQLRERLLSLGLTRGTSLHVMRAGPTGCPVELRARDVSIVLRRTEAAALQVARGTEGSVR